MNDKVWECLEHNPRRWALGIADVTRTLSGAWLWRTKNGRMGVELSQILAMKAAEKGLIALNPDTATDSGPRPAGPAPERP
jgi:hypothetical protein